MNRTALVLNPTGRRAAAARDAVLAACAEAGAGPPLVLPTTVAQPGGPQTRRALAQGCTRVVVVGGDGTVREVADALLAADRAGGPVTLGLVPAGTANLFARSTGLPRRDLIRAARTAVGAPGRPVDLARAELTGADGRTRTSTVLVVLGLGHDALVLTAVAPRAKARWRWAAYLAPGVPRLRLPGYAVSIRLDDGPVEPALVWSLLAVTAARLPWGAQVVPGARADDGLLHLAQVAPRGLLDWGRIAATGIGWRRDGGPALRHRSGQRLEVSCVEPVPAQVDGDVLPAIVGARCQLLPGALLLAAPPPT